MTVRLAVVFAFVLGAGLDCPAQQPPVPDQHVLKSETTSVVVDVIVTDGKAHHVPGLSAGDFKVYEDNSPQTISSFLPPPGVLARQQSAEGRAAANATKSAPSTPVASKEQLQTPHLITLLVDLGDLHSDRLKDACEAASRFAVKTTAAGHLVAVYWVDTRLHLGLPFTRDKLRALDVLEKISTLAPSGRFTIQERERTENEIDEVTSQASINLQVPGGKQEPDPAVQVRNMLRSLITTGNAFQARAVFVALRAIASAYRDLPGRKTVVVFSEGFPHALEGSPEIEAVIDAANRSNVAIYVIDASGMGLNAPGTRSAMGVETARAPDGLGAATFGEGPPDVLAGGLDQFDRAQTLGSNPRGDLGAIATGTGGFLVHDTNDLGAAIDRVEDDAGEYYTLAYSPTNRNYDGAFRRIKVELAGYSYHVRYRRGYWAYPPGRELLMTPAAAQLLAAVESGERKPSFTPQLSAALTPAPAGQGGVSAAVSMPGGLLHFDKLKDEYVADVSLLLIARDAKGEILAVHERYGDVRLKQKEREEFSAKTFNLQGQVLVPEFRSLSIQAIVQLADGKVGVSDPLKIDPGRPVGEAVRLSVASQPEALKIPPPAIPSTARQLPTAPSVGTRSVVDWSRRELLKNIPELKGLEPGENQGALPLILDKVGSNVMTFVRDFPNTTCTEHVSTTIYNLHGNEVRQEDHVHTYVALAGTGAERTDFHEYRADSHGNQVRPGAMATSIGFVLASIHFYPGYQRDSAFRYLGHQTIGGHDTLVVAFAQRPQVARLWEQVMVEGQAARALIQGVVWIDPLSYRIVRLRTDLLAPKKEIGLRKDTTEVEYAEVHFAQGGMTLWLPREVKLSGEIKDYSFHTRLRYSDFKLFTVETQNQLKPETVPENEPQPLPRR